VRGPACGAAISRTLKTIYRAHYYSAFVRALIGDACIQKKCRVYSSAYVGDPLRFIYLKFGSNNISNMCDVVQICRQTLIETIHSS
jgi:hypothetical protein